MKRTNVFISIPPAGRGFMAHPAFTEGIGNGGKELQCLRRNFSRLEMNAVASHEITTWLREWAGGNSSALDQLVPHVYLELKRLARRRMRSVDRDTMQTTAVVHEAYLRLVDMSTVCWQDRAHFYAVAARVMRAILVDAARARGAQKRGGLIRREKASGVDLDQIPDVGPGRAEEILAIHEALGRLAQIDARQAQVVEMRFFGGLTVDETAAVLSISPQSVMRDWKMAKAWLRREINADTSRA
jgi:RNA polymerase sigma-70 factor, ECF subfamily